MDFSDPPRKLPDSMLPMINVVFLLLIFFLMVAQLKQPEAFEVIPPVAHTAAQDRAEAKGDFVLLLSAQTLPGYRDTTGEAAFSALQAARVAHCAAVACDTAPPRLTLRADAGMPASTLATLLPRLAALGFSDVRLVTKARKRP